MLMRLFSTRLRVFLFLLCVVLVFLAMFLVLRTGSTDRPAFVIEPVTSVLTRGGVLPVADAANEVGIPMDDPTVISYLRDKFLLPPPASDVPLNLSSVWLKDTSMGQSARIREILRHMRDGFFVECGALDGETRSNTLVFERLYNWSGLLIEADPLNYREAVLKRRKVFLSPSCLSIKPFPMMVSFHQAFNMGKIDSAADGDEHLDHVDVQCFPLYSYLVALNRTTIDYFSLDVEGNELEVLETIPWDKVDIRTLSVEFIHGMRGKDVLRSYMEGKGYYVDSEITHQYNLANDFIFVKGDDVQPR